MKDESLVKALNLLIEEAVCHGGDAGGAYHQNEYNLIEAINTVLDILGLQDKYEVAKYGIWDSQWSDLYIKEK